MSWRAEISQQLLQLCKGFIQGIRAILGTWPGLLTLALLFVTLTVGLLLLSRPSRDVAARAPLSLAQIATRVPTRRALIAATATRRQPTPTALSTGASSLVAPTPTATQVGISPLSTKTATATHSTTQIVPLPWQHAGPQLDPTQGITNSQSISATLMPTSAVSDPMPVSVTGPISGSNTETSASMVTATATPDVLALLVPTPTPTRAPTATPTIIEALEQPVAPGGMAGIIATATAIAPASEAPAASSPDALATEAPTVTEAELVAPAAPVAVATVVSAPTPDGNVRSVRVPILMYHYLSVPPADADRFRIDLSVTPDLFAAQLDAMQQAGYTTISLYTLLDHLTHGTPLPEKPVVITFDDGYRDNYTNAFPLLRDRGLTATFFLVTDFINDQLPEYLTWDMVREMYAAGMSIEGHGRNHVSLANKDSDYLIWQALGTYESIAHEIGVRPHFISYPAGDYDQRTVDIFRSADYWAGFTTEQGATHHSDDLFQMERIRVRGATNPEELLRLLALDW